MKLFFLLLINLYPPTLADSSLPNRIIKSCYDGDTCTAVDGEKIRLACIDAPELKGNNSDP